jgi:hypothetical protein
MEIAFFTLKLADKSLCLEIRQRISVVELSFTYLSLGDLNLHMREQQEKSEHSWKHAHTIVTHK